MPSNAYQNYRHHVKDVESLLKLNTENRKKAQGDTDKQYLTKSALVLLAACWQTYISDVVEESITFLLSNTETIDQLPAKSRRTLKQAAELSIREDKSKSVLLSLCDDGWKTVLMSYAINRIKLTSTPGSSSLRGLFHSVGVVDIIVSAEIDDTKLDSFLGLRGEVAHSSKRSEYIKAASVRSNMWEVNSWAKDIDNYLKNHLKSRTGKRPWYMAK